MTRTKDVWSQVTLMTLVTLMSLVIGHKDMSTLTDDVDDLVVKVEGDEGNGQQSQVELEDTCDGVDVFVAVRADVCQLTICDKQTTGQLSLYSLTHSVISSLSHSIIVSIIIISV